MVLSAAAVDGGGGGSHSQADALADSGLGSFRRPSTGHRTEQRPDQGLFYGLWLDPD